MGKKPININTSNKHVAKGYTQYDVTYVKC